MHKKELEEEPAGDDTIEPNEDHSRRSSRTRSSQRRSSRSRSRRERPFRADASRSRTASPLSPNRRRVRINDIAERFDFPAEEEESPDCVRVRAEDSDQEEPGCEFENGSPSDEVASVAVEEPNWIKCSLDTGASVTVFPKAMFENLEPVGMRLRTASGEIVSGYGQASIRGEDVTGTMRKLNGNVADVHKTLISTQLRCTRKATRLGGKKVEGRSFRRTIRSTRLWGQPTEKQLESMDGMAAFRWLGSPASTTSTSRRTFPMEQH